MIKNLIKTLNMAMAMISEEDWDEFREQVETTLADLKNITGKEYALYIGRVVYWENGKHYDAYTNY